MSHRVINAAMVERAQERRADGLSLNAIAKALGCSLTALRYHLCPEYRAGQKERSRIRLQIETAPLARTNARIPRHCLRCGGAFKATHKTNRLCPNCTEYAASSSSAIA